MMTDKEIIQEALKKFKSKIYDYRDCTVCLAGQYYGYPIPEEIRSKWFHLSHLAAKIHQRNRIDMSDGLGFKKALKRSIKSNERPKESTD